MTPEEWNKFVMIVETYNSVMVSNTIVALSTDGVRMGLIKRMEAERR